jgi:hypothetical protein
MFEASAVRLTATGVNRTYRLYQIVVVHREGVEFSVAARKLRSLPASLAGFDA